MTNRLAWVDVSKGILIILVIIGHILPVDMNSELAEKFRLWIYSCHIPAFFVLNGWLKGNSTSFFKINSFKEVLIKQKKAWIMYGTFSLIFLARYIFQIILGYNTPYEGYLFVEHCVFGVGEGVLWFIPAFLVGEWLFYYAKKNFLIGGGIFSILLILYCFRDEWIITSIQRISSIPLLCYVVILRAFVAVLFMIVGYYLSYTKLLNSSVSGSFSILAIFAYINNDVDINNLIFHNEFLYVMFAILGSLLIFNISNLLITYNDKIPSSSKILNFLSLFGKESLFVMLTHTIFFIIQGSLFLSSHILPFSQYYLILAIVISIFVELVLIKIKQKLFNKYIILQRFFI